MATGFLTDVLDKLGIQTENIQLAIGELPSFMDPKTGDAFADDGALIVDEEELRASEDDATPFFDEPFDKDAVARAAFSNAREASGADVPRREDLLRYAIPNVSPNQHHTVWFMTHDNPIVLVLRQSRIQPWMLIDRGPILLFAYDANFVEQAMDVLVTLAAEQNLYYQPEKETPEKETSAFGGTSASRSTSQCEGYMIEEKDAPDIEIEI